MYLFKLYHSIFCVSVFQNYKPNRRLCKTPVAPDKTETLALSLSKYYRYTTNRNNEAMITIKDEIDALSAYLDVEKIRIGDKLSFTFDISEKVSSIYIPKFLLQPLVENAVKYGYNLEKGTTKISISFAKIGDETLKIYVCDSGSHS
ncbi:MAG: histidine kinase [Saprospiraceae bacterium]|nr:histidine kinase [Saprospiraceae bacterium]